MDVDNDSLIRIAYDWYEGHQEDSLYASSLYYMGTCFLLNDSMEQAKSCLEKSYSISDSLHNMNLKCLALDKLLEVGECEVEMLGEVDGAGVGLLRNGEEHG